MRPLSTTVRRSPARTALRATTHEIHERMHHHPALPRLAAGTIARDEYRHVLARSYGFYATVEPVIGLASTLTACLFGDLMELGMTPAAIDDLPRCAPLAIGQGQAELTGARYVLLGASPGGKVMARAMSSAALRDVSFIHREYLRNMGVDSSISIIFAGRLWGLMACHHFTPRRLPRHLRVVCELLGSMFSLQLEARLLSRKGLSTIMHSLAQEDD